MAEGFSVPEVVIPPYIVTVENLCNEKRKVRNTRSNHIILIRNVEGCEIVIDMNQKIRKLILQNCKNTLVQMLDSAVVMTRTVEMIDCTNLRFETDEVDVRNLRLYDCTDVTLRFSDSETLIENFHMYFYGTNQNNKVHRVLVSPGTNPNEYMAVPMDLVKAYDIPPTPSGVEVLDCQLVLGKDLVAVPVTSEEVLKRTKDVVLADIVKAFEDNVEFKKLMKGDQLAKLYEEELREFEEDLESLDRKAQLAAEAIRKAEHVVVYTGAGISTSADLPDYRGPEGVWTLQRVGGSSKKNKDLGEAKPTYAHYAISELVRRGIVKFIISTNMDGLHIRSGVPQDKISELHGNCYKEICEKCDRQYMRHFDTLPTRTDRWTHYTGRNCECGGKLKDTIVHFTENIRDDQWIPAVENARKSDVALVLGTSMYVQPAASIPDKCLNKPNGKLIIVNLQRTPYDEAATLRVFSKTDLFMHLLMKHLGIETFDTEYDAITIMRQQIAAEERKRFIRKLIMGTVVGVAVAATAFALRGRFPVFGRNQ